MWQSLLVQCIAVGAGLSGIFLADRGESKWVLAGFVILAAISAIVVAWTERESKAFANRALESLILSTRPNDLARQRVIGALNKAAGGLGMPTSQVLGFSGGTYQVRFFDTKEAERAVFSFNDEWLSRVAILPDKRLGVARLEPFKKPTRPRSRDELVGEISLAARTCLWERGISTPNWCVWADDARISVPVNPPDACASEANQVAFSSKKCAELARLPVIELHTLVHSEVREILDRK